MQAERITDAVVQQACLAYGPKAFPGRMRKALEVVLAASRLEDNYVYVYVVDPPDGAEDILVFEHEDQALSYCDTRWPLQRPEEASVERAIVIDRVTADKLTTAERERGES